MRSPHPVDRVACSRRRQRPGGAREESTIGRDGGARQEARAEARLGDHRGRVDPQADAAQRDVAHVDRRREDPGHRRVHRGRSTTSPTSTRCCRRTSSTTTAGSRATWRSPGSSATSALGGFLTSAGQIPVERLSRNAIGAYDAAVKAISEGECIVIYPEGTLTRDPDLWPMKGKTGAARIALATGCPVIPVGQWGAQEVLPPYTKRPHLVPRKNIVMKAGDPVDLDDLLGLPASAETTARATDRIMAAVTGARGRPPWRDRPRAALRPPQQRRTRDRQPARHRPRRGPPDEEEAHPMTKIAVFSAGSWGTAFSLVLADAGNDVSLWARREEVVEADQRAPREHRLPAGHRAAAVDLGVDGPRAGRRRRGRRRAHRPVADPPREPHRRGRRSSPRRPRSCR